MSTAPKPQKPDDLAKLEHAFATDPSSEAYRPLAEAYLAMGRFMEAMVVCKKGVKAHPTKSEPRMLLARVYADQGKDKKALDELVAAVQVVSGDRALLRMTGELQMKVGERDAARASLLKALELDSNDAETLATLKRHGVEPPRAAPPPPPPPPATASGPPRLEPVPLSGASTPGRTSVNGAAASSGRSTTGSHPVPRVRRPTYDEIERAEEKVSQKRQQRSRSLVKVTAISFGVAVVVSIGLYGYGQWRATKVNEFKREMKIAVDEVKHDSFASYQKATEAAEKALEADSGNAKNALLAHGLLSYVWALRWGEHGGGDSARAKAEEHLEAARELARTLETQDSYLIAADALYQSYSGQGGKARAELSRQVSALREERRESATLNLTLGIIQMNAGDTEAARDSLTHAQELAQSDARIYAALGTFYRRQGQDRLARDNFDAALRFERGHPESMLGLALTILERDRADYRTASTTLKNLITMEPPPSPRQLAVAHLARALLIARVSKELPEYTDQEFQRKLSEMTGVPMDGRKAQAEAVHEEDAGFQMDPRNPELRLLKGKRLLLEGQVDAAAQEMRAGIELDRNRAQLYVELARVLMLKSGGEKEAIAALTTALRNMGESPKLLVLLGQAYRKAGNLSEALVQFQRAVADPKVKNPEARLALGSIYREQRDYAHAIESLDKATREYVGQRSKVAEVYTELGRAYEDKGERAHADESFQAALKSDAEFAPAYYFYGKFLSTGDKATAVRGRDVLFQYLKLDPHGEFADEARHVAQP